MLTLNSAIPSTGAAFDPRDFAALERTNLGYARTANAFAIFGVLMTQLYVLANFDRTFGIVFACVAYCGAIVITALGCFRYFALQQALTLRKPLHTGWYLLLIWMFTILMAVGLFLAIITD